MPDRTSYAPGTPSWVDLATTDMDAARDFYGSLFGWDFDEQPANGSFYVMASKRGKAAAGIFPQQQEHRDSGMSPMWTTYVTVADIDAMPDKVTAAGGQVVAPPFDVMDAGRMSVAMDPTGAAFAMWQKKEAIGAELVNEHGSLTWNELVTPGVEEAKQFYGAVFGWTATDMDMGAMTYTTFELDGQGVAGAMPPPMEGMPAFWGVYFAVDDCDATVEAAKARGATLLAGPMDIPPGRMATFQDPQGAAFSVIQLASEPA